MKSEKGTSIKIKIKFFHVNHKLLSNYIMKKIIPITYYLLKYYNYFNTSLSSAILKSNQSLYLLSIINPKNDDTQLKAFKRMNRNEEAHPKIIAKNIMIHICNPWVSFISDVFWKIIFLDPMTLFYHEMFKELKNCSKKYFKIPSSHDWTSQPHILLS